MYNYGGERPILSVNGVPELVFEAGAVGVAGQRDRGWRGRGWSGGGR